MVFKDYSPNQILLIPPSLEDMIDPNHPVRVVNQVIDSIDLDVLLKKYKGGGCSSYHPRLILKILVYGYLTNQYSSRKIDQAVTQNIHFMWLSGMSLFYELYNLSKDCVTIQTGYQLIFALIVYINNWNGLNVERLKR